MMSNITVGLRDSNPIRIGDPRGVAVSLSSAGLGGDFTVRMKIPSIDYEESKQTNLPSFGKSELYYRIEGSSDSVQLCDMILEVLQEDKPVVSKTLKVDVLPEFCFDRMDKDFLQSICDAVDKTSDKNGTKDSISNDMIAIYDDLNFIQLMDSTNDRYLNLTPPNLVPEFGDGTKEDIAVSYLSMIRSRGYSCCLAEVDGDLFVGVSNESRSIVNISKLLDSYSFIRPSDSCQGISASVSMDLSKTVLRQHLGLLKAGSTIGYID